MIVQKFKTELGKPLDMHAAVNLLERNGYQLKLRRESTCLYCIQQKTWIDPDEFIVDTSYHFEEGRGADVARTVYAISIADGQKGILVDSCFVYEDNISSKLSQKLNML